MNRRLISLLSLALGLLVAGSIAPAQERDVALPTPPPDGRFFFVGAGPMFERLKPVTGAPFSAQASTRSTEVLADGNQIDRTETAQLTRDSAGRTRRDSTLSHIGPWAASEPHRIINITDPVGGMNYLLDATDKTVVKSPAHEHKGGDFHLQKRADVGSAGQSGVQRTTESLGTQTMAGVSVQGTRTTETIAAGAIGNQNPITVVSERWYSPDLQTVVYSKHADPRFGTTIYQLTNITRQEPDPSLFQVPSDYTVKERSGHMRFKGSE